MAESSDDLSGFTIEHLHREDPAIVAEIRQGLTAYNRSQIPNKGYAPVLLRLLAADGAFCGGLSGQVSYGWLFIDSLWVAESARSGGNGRKLVLTAEDTARSRGARHAWVDTFSFQARGFYEKLGYVVFGELKDYPPGHSRYFLRKDLS